MHLPPILSGGGFFSFEALLIDATNESMRLRILDYPKTYSTRRKSRVEVSPHSPQTSLAPNSLAPHSQQT